MYYYGQSQELRATRTPYEHSKTGTRYHGEDYESSHYATVRAMLEKTPGLMSAVGVYLCETSFWREKNQRLVERLVFGECMS